jgi:hypothetical protein
LIISVGDDAVKLPPVKIPVPVRVTGCAAVMLVQKGVPAYEMDAVGNCVMVTVAVALTEAHPPAAGMVYVMVYVPGVLPFGTNDPVEGSTESPVAGLTENVPPVVPAIVTFRTVLSFWQYGPPA